jgi:hypothetical protein
LEQRDLHVELLAFASRTPDSRYDEEDQAKQPARKITHFFSRLNDEGRPGRVLQLKSYVRLHTTTGALQLRRPDT